MPSRTIEEERILAYACYRIILKYKDGEGKVNGLRFNKMISLLDNELLNDEVDIKLPSCWYFYGPVVVPRELPIGVRFESNNQREEDKSAFFWEGGRPKPPGKIKSKIDALVDRLYNNYPPDGNVFEALNAVYEIAPFQFQLLYKDFRNDSLDRSMVDPNRTFTSEWLLSPEINGAIKKFPFNDFVKLKVPATQVDILTTAIFSKASDRNEIGIALAKAFWEIFCKFLRVHEKGHKYVSNDKLDRWREIAENDFKTFQEHLQTQIKMILDFLTPDAIDDPMDLMFLDPMEFDTEEDIDTTLYG